MLKLIEQGNVAEVCWVVLSGNAERAQEARASAAAFLGGVSACQVVLRDFRDGFFPYVGGEIKDCFEELKRSFAPDIVFTHQRMDLHQDHRLTCELTCNTFRDHLILEYEVPKYDGDLGAPNLFVPLSEELCRRKIELLLAHFSSQLPRDWFDDDLFAALLRLRGMEAGAPGGRAEAFYCRKATLA